MQFWHGLLLAGALCGFGVMAHRHQKGNDLKRIDAALDREISLILANFRDETRPPRRQGPRAQRPRMLRDFIDSEEAKSFLSKNDLDGDYIVIWRRNGTELGRVGDAPETIPFPEAANRERAYNIQRTRGNLREIYRFLKPGECLLLGKSIQSESREWRRLAWQLAGSGFGILALGLLGGWFFLSRSIRPIQTISQSARRFATGELDTRIPHEDTGGELGQLTMDLNETFDQLEQAFARQSRFTADAAHELRTPVSVILSHAQAALARDREANAYKEALITCERGAKRLQQLIDSLLTLTTLDAKTDSAPEDRVDLGSIAQECTAFMEPLLDARDLTLETQIDPAPCYGRTDQLQQVLMNLLANAVNFSGPGQCIRLTTGEREGSAWAQVTDQGQGIAPEHLPHLFERFYRADPARKRGEGGAGLGLAICQEIIRAHEGVIDVKSEVGMGTTFTITLTGVSK